MKVKFSSCFTSVRKAFLLLDTDYDGLITIEDILKYFGNDKDLNFDDLHKLMVDKDSKKQGKITYTDFSKWLGSDIYMSEGYYFRHDSIMNPSGNLALEKYAKVLGKDKEFAAVCTINERKENPE